MSRTRERSACIRIRAKRRASCRRERGSRTGLPMLALRFALRRFVIDGSVRIGMDGFGLHVNRLGRIGRKGEDEPQGDVGNGERPGGCKGKHHGKDAHDDGIDVEVLGNTRAYLEVADLDAAISQLRALGIDSFRTEQPVELPGLFGGLRNIFFTGPSGELIELLQHL